MAMGNEKAFATLKVRWKIMLDMKRKGIATVVCRSCGEEVGHLE